MMTARWMLLAVIFFLSLPVHGHVGDRVIPIYELTDEMLNEVDLRDGSVDDWEALFGTPTLTLLDFWLRHQSDGALSEQEKPHDPSDMDFRIWLGWNDTNDRIYFGAIFVDDEYVNTLGEEYSNGTDSVRILVDGDHSGGLVEPNPGSGHFAVPSYEAVAEVAEGPMVQKAGSGADWASGWKDWMNHPPYSDGGGMVTGESPAISVIEFYVTAFDLLIATSSPDESLVSDLVPGGVIGVELWIFDFDFDGRAVEWYNMTNQDFDDDGNWLYADGFVDALLLDAADMSTDGSAVLADSWGRIKASLGN